MKAIIGLLGLVTIMFAGGCVVEPAYPSAGVSVGVYGEYPHTYYGHGYHGYYGHRRWYHPYDRDHYYYRGYPYRTW